MCHSSTRPGMWYVIAHDQFYRVSTARNTHWGEKAWIQATVAILD